MHEVMIDFETLGNGKNCCLVQVGACYFNRETGEIGGMFEANIDAASSIRSGADMDASTVYWWLEQSDEARASILLQPREDIREVMLRLNLFLADAKCIWSHATFDFVALTETLKRLNIKPMFHYRAARDIRTLVDLASISLKDTPREGLHHNGLADCLHQVKYCVKALQLVKKRIGSGL